MEKIKKLFGNYDLKWFELIILAVATALITAAFLTIPTFNGTSFEDLGTYPDCWILFAMFIILNCKRWQEASLKCFVFFLISQPLIYLFQVPFSPMGWQLFMYYPRWLVATFLTIPGAAIAFLVKKKNWLSVVILGIANCYLSIAAINYYKSAIVNFPHHLLSFIVCLGIACFLSEVSFDEPKHKKASLFIIIFSFAFANYVGSIL